MQRREFINLVGSAAVWPLMAHAQQPGRVWRIGVLETTSMQLHAANYDSFRQSLRDLGYVEKQNFVIEYRSAEGQGERFAGFASLERRRDRNEGNARSSRSEKSHDDDTHCHGSNG
jgi:putative ABC transport system substrate-binding protein